MILLAIAITILCIGSVSAVEETNATLETVNEISQDDNIVINEMADETITNDDSKEGSVVSDSNDKQNIENKEILKASDGEDALGADVSGYIEIRETNSETTGTFESDVGEEIGIDLYWQSLNGMKFKLLVNGNSVNEFYPRGYGYDWTDTLYYTPESPGTYNIMVICQGSSDRYISNTLTWEVSGSSAPKATQVDLKVPSTGFLDNSFNIPYTVTTTSGKAVNEGTLTFYDQNGQIGSPITLTSSSGTFTHTYSAENTYDIYAKYTGNDNYEDSQSSTDSIDIIDGSGLSTEITLSFNQGSTNLGNGYLYPFSDDHAWISVQSGNYGNPTYVNFNVDFGINSQSSTVIQYKKSTESNWKDISFEGTAPSLKFHNANHNSDVVTWAAGYTYDVRVSNGDKISNVLSVTCIQGYSYINDFDYTPESGDEGTTIDFKFKPILSNDYYSFTEAYVSFFSDESRDASSLLGTLTASSSSQFSNKYLTGQITLPLVDATGEYTVYYAFVGKTSNGGYNDLDSFTLTINDIAVINKDTTISLTPDSYTIIQGDSQIITPSVIDSDSQSVNTGTITYYDNDNPISDYTDVSISTTFDTSILSVGNHTIKAKYNGDGGYNPSELSIPVTVTVNQPVGFSIVVTNITYPNNPTATVIGEEGKTYTITVTGTGKSFTVTIPAGQTRVTQDLGALAAGDNYEAKVSYNSKTNTTTFNISRATPVLTINNIIGNNSLLSDTHSFTVNAQGSGKIETNFTSQQFDIGDVITLTGLVSGSNKIKVTYLGDENYTQATQNITFVVYDKYSTEITLELNETGIAKGNKIRAIPTVNNGDLTVGEVAFYYEDGTLIDTINLSEKQYLEFTPRGDEGDTIKIYAKYVANTNYAESTNSNMAYVKIKKSFTITLTVSGDSVYRTGSYYNGPTYVFSTSTEDNLNLPVQVLDDFNGYDSPILYDVSIGKTTDSQVGSFYFESREIGDHDIYVKFMGNDEYLASESNHIQFTVFESRTVSGIEFNPNYGIEGEEVIVTPSIYYQAGYYSDKIYLNNGTLKLYSDSSKTNLIATVKLGESFTYTAPEVTSSYYPYSQNTIYAAFVGVNDGYAYSTPSNLNGYFYSMEENNLLLTGNDKTGTVEVNANDNITLKIDLDSYYNQGNRDSPPVVKIYVDDEFKANIPTVYNSGYGTHSFGDYNLNVSGLSSGEHTVYVVYEGYHDSSRHYSETTSNTLIVKILKSIEITLNPETITIKQGESESIVPVISVDSLTDGNITYYDEGTPITGFIEVPLNTPFTTSDLTIGKHTITVKYNGVGDYASSDKSNPVTVIVKGDKTATVEVTGADYPNNVTIRVTSEIHGEYTVDINNVQVTVTVAEGAAYGEATYKLAAGSYYANITTSPVSELYDVQTQNATFDVNKAVNNVVVTVEDVTLPDGRVTVNVVADVAGTYVVKLNDTENTEITVAVTQPGVSASNTTAKKILSGKYSANTTFADDKNYTVTITNDTFDVVKGEITVKVIFDKDEFIYGEDIVGKVEISDDLPFTLKINDKEITVDNDGIFNAGVLDVNSYAVNVTFAGDDNYNKNSHKQDFTVVKATNNVKVEVTATNFKENVTVKVTADVDGLYAVDINSTIVNVLVSGGSGENKTKLKVGSYYANTTFENDNYETKVINTTFSVLKLENNIKISIDDAVLPSHVKVNVTADVDDEYIITIGDQTVNVKVEQGKGSNTIKLANGTYTATTEFTNENYTAVITDAHFKVSKGEITLQIIIPQTVIYSNNVTGTVIASVDGKYYVKIGENEAIEVNVNSNVGNFDAGKLPVAKYNATVTFDGDDDYGENSNKTSFEVTLSGTDFKAYANESTITYGGNIKLIHELPSDASGTVTYTYINGTPIDTVNAHDEYELIKPEAGSYVIIAEYSGDSNYAGISVQLYFKIDPAINKITVGVTATNFKENVTVKVTADVDGLYAVNINNTNFNVLVTGGLGEIKTKFKAGSYYANVTYADKNYIGDITNDTFNVETLNNDINIIIDETNTLPDEITVKVTATIDDTYIVNINTTQVTVEVRGGEGSNNISLPAGVNYNATTTWSNENYTVNINNQMFNVVKGEITVKVTLDKDVFVYGENITGKVEISQDLPIILKINDKVVSVNDDGSFDAGVLAADSYVANLTFDGSDDYKANYDKQEFTVKQAINNIEVIVNRTNVLPGEITVNVTADVDDTYSVDINGTVVLVEVVKGKGNNSISLPAGENYNANITWVNDNYTVIVTNATFDVVKCKNNVIIETDESTYPNNVTIKITADIAGKYNIKLTDDVILEVEIPENGASKEIIYKLAADDYTASIINYVNETYELVSTPIDFKVTPAKNNIVISANKTNKLPNTILINVAADVDDTYIIDINGTIVSVEVVGGNGSATVRLSAGENYNATTSWSNNNYTSEVTNALFDIVKSEIAIKVILDKDEFVYGENVTGKVEISEDLPFTLKINNQTVTVDREGGFNAGVLDVNAYAADVTFTGSDNYNANSNKTEFIVKKATNNIKVIIEDTTLPNHVTVKLTADVDNTYTVNINGTEVSVKVENKSGTNTTSLKAGTYEANINYTSSNYDVNITKDVFNVLKAKAELTISANASEITESEAIKLTYELSQNATGEVKFYDNGELITDINNIVLTAGNHNITAKYDGDDNYDGASDEIMVKVAEKTNNINLEIIPATYPENITVKVTSDKDGEYIVKINDTEVPVKIVNGSGEASVNLPAGNYTAKLENQSVDFTVSAKDKVNPVLKSTFDDGVLTVEVPGDAGGNVTVKVGDNTYAAEIRDGKAVFNLSDLNAGNYSAQITYSGDDQYNSNTAATEINIPVKETKNNINLSVESVKLPENVTVIVKADNDGNYTVDINGTNVEVEVKNNTGTASINLSAGNYTAKLENQSVDFTVSPMDKLTPELKSTFDDGVLTVEVPGDAGGNVTVKVGDNTYAAEIRDSKAVFNLSDLNAGNYSAQITYSGDENYSNTSDSVKITIPSKDETLEKTNAQMDVSVPNTITVGDDVTIDVKLPDDATGNVTILLDGKQLSTVKAENGTVSIPVNNVGVGVYVVEIRYSGDDKYNETTQMEAMLVNDKISVKKDTIITANATLTRTANEHYKTGENGTDYYVTLTDIDGNPLANKTIQMAINGVIYEIPTDINGQAHQIINMESANVYTYAFSFQGDDEYNAAPLTSTRLTVTKKATTITAKAASFKKSAKTKKLTVTLGTVKNADGKIYLAKGKKITLKVNGKTYSGKTNAKNQVTFNLKLTKKGKFTAKIKFAGSKIYASSSKSVKITIK